MPEDDIRVYFSGKKLYGDDLDEDRINRWFKDEEEAYANLRQSHNRPYRYQWHHFDQKYVWDKLPAGSFDTLLAFGAADGNEVRPVGSRFKQITIVEPSDQLTVTEVAGVPVRYVKPHVSGVLPFADETFDVITCFGVLHHIPNVSAVIREFGRVLKRGGHAAVREPTTSMNDWRQSRRGLTKHERGIPVRLMRRMFQDAGLRIVFEKRYNFPFTTRLARLFKASPYESEPMLAVDAAASMLFGWNHTYHTNNPLLKLRSNSAQWIVTKDAPAA